MADTFVVQGIAPQQSGISIFDIPVPLSDYLSAERRNSFENTFTRKSQMEYLSPNGGEIISKERAKEVADQYGVIVNDVPDEGISSEKFLFNLKRQIQLNQYQRTIARKPKGALASALGFGAAMLPEVVDPVNVGIGLVPVVGPARYSAMLARSSTVLGRGAIRFGLGAVEAGTVTAALEPANYMLSKQLGDDYTTYDSFMNIAFGAGLGGVFSSGGGLVADAWKVKFGGVATPITKADRNEILQVAAQLVTTDTQSNIKRLMNFATLKNTLHTLDEIEASPELQRILNEKGAPALIELKVKERLATSNPDLTGKITDLENQLKLTKKERTNVYDRALQEYNDLESFAASNPNEINLIESKKKTFADRYGKDFVEEAKAYDTYSKKMDNAELSTDARNKKILLKDAQKLNDKYDGRLKDIYDSKKALTESDIQEHDRIKAEIDRITSYNTELTKRQMIERAVGDYIDEKKRILNTEPVNVQERINRLSDEVRKETEARIKENDLIDPEEEIQFFKDEMKKLSEKGIDYGDQIDDSLYDIKPFVKSMRDYLTCLRG